jgi:hypothetical protein
VDNPISIRQAFWSPYKKLVRMIEENAAKKAAAAEAASTAKLETVAKAGDGAKPPEVKKVDVGAVAAMGVAFGALSTAAAYFLGAFKNFESWQIPLVLGVVMLLISAPSMAIAWLKLRKRNLGPILDANGWAVNAKAKMNVPFGGALTGVAALPPGAQMGAADEYAEKPSRWPKILLVTFVLWFIWAFLNDSQGRLYNWTENYPAIQLYATPPLAVREQIAKDKLDKAKAEKAAADAAAGVAPAAPAAPAAPTVPAAPAK